MNIKGTVLNTLRSSSHPMSASEIYDLNDSLETVASVSSALFSLRKNGLVRQAGERPPAIMKPGAKNVMLFQSCENKDADAAEFARLVEAIEETMSEEEIAIADQLEPNEPDAILASINQINAEPFPNAEIHSTRLRALADVPILEESVAQWLYDIADLIEQRAAA